MYLILSAGLDSSLLWKRALLLKSAGHIVVSSSSLKQAVDRVGAINPDLILLCHSIPSSSRLGKQLATVPNLLKPLCGGNCGEPVAAGFSDVDLQQNR
jgi:hypothetical protein